MTDKVIMLIMVIFQIFMVSCTRNSEIIITDENIINSTAGSIMNDDRQEYGSSFINTNNAHLCSIPQLNSIVVMLMREGTTINITSRTAEEVSIDGYSNYWYKVIKDDSTEGWIFGKYLSSLPKEEINIFIIEEGLDYTNATIFWTDSPIDDGYTILLYSGNYNFNNEIYEQNKIEVSFCYIVIETNDLESKMYKGFYQAGFQNQNSNLTNGKVREPVFIEINDSEIRIDTLVNLYDGLSLTNRFRPIHFNGVYNWFKADN